MGVRTRLEVRIRWMGAVVGNGFGLPCVHYFRQLQASVCFVLKGGARMDGQERLSRGCIVRAITWELCPRVHVTAVCK